MWPWGRINLEACQLSALGQLKCTVSRDDYLRLHRFQRSPNPMQSVTVPQDHNVLPYSRPETPGPRPQIGFVGLGAIGYFMARNLATHLPPQYSGSPPLLVWNRSTTKSEKLQQEVGKNHVRIAQSLAQIATECDVVISALANDEVVKSVYEEYSNALTVSVIAIEQGISI
jgi:hypothetical protein